MGSPVWEHRSMVVEVCSKLLYMAPETPLTEEGDVLNSENRGIQWGRDTSMGNVRRAILTEEGVSELEKNGVTWMSGAWQTHE